MISLQETDYSQLRTRFDNDMALYYLEQYVLLNPETNKPANNSVSITLNDPRTYGDRCLAIMSADTRSFDITGVDKTIQAKLEKVYTHWLYLNDEQLEKQSIESLDDCVNFFDLFRGWIGGLVLMYQDGDKYLPSILPVDPRWMSWETDDSGLKAFGYRTRALRVAVEEKYKTKLSGVSQNSRFVDLKHIWTRQEYLIYAASDSATGIQGTQLNSIQHGLGICPGVVVDVPTQPMLITGNYDYATALSRQGESIYAPNRDTYPVLNKVASILASIMQEAYMSSIVYKGTKEGLEGDPTGAGKYLQINPDEEITLMPARDLNRATEYLFGILGSSKQRGSLSDINYGQIAFELSALAVAQLKDDRDGIFTPRRKAKKTFYRRAFNILRHQILHGGFKTDIDKDDAISIDKSLFQKKCVVNINFSSISPEENISNFTIANQAQAIGLPLSKIYRNILHDDDPEGTIREARLERAYAQVPLLELYDMAIATDPGGLTEDKINADRALIIMDAINKQLDQPQMPDGTEPAGIASQPKNTAKVGRGSSEKMAQAKLKETGLMNSRNAQRSKNAGE